MGVAIYMVMLLSAHLNEMLVELNKNEDQGVCQMGGALKLDLQKSEDCMGKKNHLFQQDCRKKGNYPRYHDHQHLSGLNGYIILKNGQIVKTNGYII